VAPTSTSIESTIAFLSTFVPPSAIKHATSNSDMITVETTYAVAEAMLQNEYNLYSHGETGHKIARSMEYSLPEELADHVALVGPTTRFPKPSSSLPTVMDVEFGTKNTPDNLRELYSVHDVLGGASDKNIQAVTAFLGQYYSESDMDKFWDTQLPAGKGTPITLVGDATDGGRAGVESMLDIEYMPAMSAQNPTEFWGFSGASPQDKNDEPFLTWLEQMATTDDDKVPLVFSTSYGEDESAEVPSDYADRINAEFQKAALRGISILFASGDSGAASDTHTCPNDQFCPMW